MQNIQYRFTSQKEDPKIDITARKTLRNAYPGKKFEVIPNTGLTLMYQEPEKVISILAGAAKPGSTHDLSKTQRPPKYEWAFGNQSGLVPPVSCT